MKKTVTIVLAFLCMLLFCSAVFAKADVSASVRNKVLGTWRIDAEAVLDDYIDSMLAENGIYRSNPQYAYYKAYARQMAGSDAALPGMEEMRITLGKDKAQLVMQGGNTMPDADYKIDKEGVLYITGDKGTTPIGSFNNSYTKLYLMGGDTFYLVKM